MVRKKLTIVNTKGKKITDGFKEFYRYCQIKNLSHQSLEFYENNFLKFKLWLKEDILISDIAKATMEDYILYLKSTKVADTTINTNIRGIRAVLYYWMNLGYLENFKISKIKAVKQVKDTYTKQEIEILLKKPNLKKSSFVTYRSWVCINLLLGTGMRADTLVNLRIKDVDLDNKLLFYSTTKNKKQQIVPISTTLINVLDEYIQVRLRQVESMDEYLFVSAYGEKMNRNSLNHSLRNYNRSRGVLRIGVHKWRHTFAKISLVDGNLNPLKLQAWLGHSDLDMVKEYVNIFTEDLQKDCDDFNPLEIMQKQNKRGDYLKLR